MHHTSTKASKSLFMFNSDKNNASRQSRIRTLFKQDSHHILTTRQQGLEYKK